MQCNISAGLFVRLLLILSNVELSQALYRSQTVETSAAALSRSPIEPLSAAVFSIIVEHSSRQNALENFKAHNTAAPNNGDRFTAGDSVQTGCLRVHL